jgi:hypothetical protein
VSGQADDALLCLAHQVHLCIRGDDPLRERANTFYEYAQRVLTKRINAWRTTSIDSDRMREKDKDKDGMF